MASKVMVKLPCTPFGQQVNKPEKNANEDLIATKELPEDHHLEVHNGSKLGRIAQLEQNIQFLQQQHQQMLSDLHKEIENLRCRNRDLLFRLIFNKNTVPSSPSSPEDEFELKVSPKNTIPLQVELLEKELAELKLQLQESENRNAYVLAIVEEQKKKFERLSKEKDRELERVSQPDPELLHKLDDAEALIRRLRRENSELRRNQTANSASSNSSESYRQRERGSYQNQKSGSSESKANRYRGNSRGNFRGNWFPPLHSQSYWRGGRGADKSGETGDGGTSFPNLTNHERGGSGSNYQNRRGTNNNNRYSVAEGRKFESAQSKGIRRT